MTRAQLGQCGVSRSAVEARIRNETLLRVHRGVYRVGHRAPSVLADYMAAVLACGPGALLSGRAAAYLHRLVRGAAPTPEVSSPRDRRVPGIEVHCVAGLDPRDAGSTRGIPATKIARTLLDLAAVLTQPQLARAAHEAGILYGVGAPEVEAAMARRPNSPGAATLRRVIHGDVNVSLSALESRFLSLLESVGLPTPETNVRASGRTVDARWPAHHLTVELDGYRYHASRHAWELDRAREREAYARGDELRRYTYADVFEHPARMLAELRVALG